MDTGDEQQASEGVFGEIVYEDPAKRELVEKPVMSQPGDWEEGPADLEDLGQQPGNKYIRNPAFLFLL